MINLTVNEKVIMDACLNTDYGSALNEGIWSFAVANAAKMNTKEYRGTVSSLVKKGLVKIYDYEEKGRFEDMVFCLTEKGKAYIKGE
jgi:predicted transcriptional regulator